MHMVPGLEGKSPAEFRRESREAILAKYTPIDFQDVQVDNFRTLGRKATRIALLWTQTATLERMKLPQAPDCRRLSDIFPNIESL